jgi:hypothetical protein
MSNIVNNFTTGIITISEEFNLDSIPPQIDSTPIFNTIGQEWIVSFIQLDRVEKFTRFSVETIGNLQTRYLEVSYRISRNGNTWSNFYSFDEFNTTTRSLTSSGVTYSITKTEYTLPNFPPFDPLDPMFIDLKFIRSGSKSDGEIRLFTYNLEGELLRDEKDGTILLGSGKESVIKPPYVYKVFRIDNVEIVTNSDLSSVELFWRYTQDNSRTWSNWEPLTKENISTKRINPIRFFQIEYLVKNNSSSTIKIQDINLIGDFQNVTLDSQKTNLYGIRECCQSFLLANSANSSNAGAVDENGNFIANSSGVLSGQACSSDNQFKPLTPQEKSTLYNPYQQTAAQNLLNKLSNDAMEVFGHKVQYFVTDPDGNGIDYSLHEFGLFNISCEGELKVAVEGNQFPDNQIMMNQFDLNLFDSFEVHITKESFKILFGVQRRPSKEDLVYFCDLNRLFIVDHAQQFRSFNNYATYYKVVLRKYNKSSNVQAGSPSIKERIEQLTNNSTIDELFGIENNQDKAAIANKPQLQPLTRDPIRVVIDGINTNSLIVKELIENSTNIISKQHYDFSDALIGGNINQPTAVVKYRNLDPRLKVSDNIGFFLWFNLNNYMEGEVHNLFTYYDDVNNLGWKINLESDVISVTLNSDTYTWNLDSTPGDVSALYENVWYCYLVNIDQRQRNLNQYIYKRDVDPDSEDDAKYLTTTTLQKVYSNEQVMVPVEYELEGVDAQILISDMKVTNVRLFVDIIPEETQSKLLNQYIIADDSKYLVFADSANLKLSLPNFPYNGTSYDNS